jgi:hypothetical protein
MQKGDMYTIIAIVIILAVLALLVLNLDKIFPTPTVQEAIKQVVNAT